MEDVASAIGWAGVFIALGMFLGFCCLRASFDEIALELSYFKDHYERWVDAQVDRPDVPPTYNHISERDDDSPGFDLSDTTPEYPDPTEADLKSPRFEAIWQAIKGWDISRHPGHRLYSGPTGNDVMHILKAVDQVDHEEARGQR